MANDVADFIPYKLIAAIAARLETITQAGGYNCQPLVTLDPRRAIAEADKAVILVMPQGITPSNVRPGAVPAWTLQQEIGIYGQVPAVSGDPWQDCYALLQDVLYCLGNYYSGIATAIGRGGAIDFGDMSVTIVPLDSSDVTLFHVPLNVAWNVIATEM